MHTFDDFVPQRRFQDAVALSPDGTRVAYSAHDDGAYSLLVRPVVGGEARRIARFADRSVRAVAWSPAGDRLAFSADRDGDEQTQIFVVGADSGEPERLTPRDDRQYALADQPFTPDGAALVYTGNDRDESASDVLVHDLTSGAVRRIALTPGITVPVAVSPDGRLLTLLVLHSNSDSDVVVAGLDGDDDVRTVAHHNAGAKHFPGPWLPDSSGFWLRTDRDAEFLALATCTLDGEVEFVDAPDADVEFVATSPGRTAWVVNSPGGSVPVVRDEPDGEPVAVPLPVGVLEEVRLSDDGATLVGLLGSGVRPRELVALDVATARLTYLTESRPVAIVEGEPVAPVAVTYPTHDGRDVPAWLYRPSSATGDGPFPVLLSVHGGPEAQERAEYNYSGLYQYLLSRGIGVLAPNVRGSTGYGSSYQKLIQRDWGGGELGDLEHAVLYLRTLDWVDGNRIGVFGGSFGGFAALSCLSRLPELFAAGVSLVGPSNLVTVGRSVPATWRPLIRAWLGDPDDDHDFLMSRSPITYADQIVAPLFVIQGAKDPRVVKAESDQIVDALRARGVEVRYDVYEDEGHGFTKRENEIRALGDIASFLVEQLVPAGAVSVTSS